MKHELPKLPYAFTALEPIIDAKTMEIHWSKHHQTYIDKLNVALDKHPELKDKKVEELLANNLKIVPEDIKPMVRNHGGGHANHSLFWTVLTGKKIENEFEGKIAEAIKKEFGSFEEFQIIFSETALNKFGSGWAWLVLNGKKLEVYSTSNQDSPVMEGKKPILGLDVWEHAFYLRYLNRKADYISAWWSIINWKKVNELYENGLKG